MIGSAQQRLTRQFSERLPDRKSVWGVYAVIVFLVYSWTLVTSFYKLPSWMFYLTIDQILSIYAYSFSLNLLESIFLLVGVLFLHFTIFLPLKNKDEFQARSILIVFTLLVSSMTRLLLYKSYESSEAFVNGELTWWILTFFWVALFSIIMPKKKLFRSIFAGVAERVLIFLYIYIPLSFISLIIVTLRNIN